MKLIAVLFLPALVGAAILPDDIGAYHRTGTAPAAVTDRPVWNEYGLQASESASYENGAEHLTVSAWQLQDTTGALGAFDWQRPADATPPMPLRWPRKPGSRCCWSTAITCSRLTATSPPKRNWTPLRVAQERGYHQPAGAGRIPALRRPGAQQRALHHRPGRLAKFDSGDSALGGRLSTSERKRRSEFSTARKAT